MRPRLTVFRSNKFIYAQLIDDLKGETLAAAERKLDPAEAGSLIAKKALEKGIKKIVFDRNGYKYHGKIKKLAEAAREAGLLF